MKAWILENQATIENSPLELMEVPQPEPVTMIPIEIKDYNLIWQERSIISLAHITRKDCIEFLQLVNKIKLKASIEVFPFEDMQEALIKVKHGKVNGNAIIQIAKNETI